MTVLILGALHHDVVVDAPALPRVDETLQGTGVDYRFGGKGGNQALAAARMGARVAMAGRVGDDAPGRLLLQTLDGAGVDRAAVTVGRAATGMSVAIALPGGDYGAVILSGANLENDGQVACSANVAVIQNEIPPAANARFVADLPDDVTLVWNAAPARAWQAEIAARTDLLVVNRVEAQDVADTDAPQQAAERLAARVRGAALVTLGEKGAVLADAGGCTVLPAFPATPVSTHGAGDMFTGALAAQLAEGAALEQAVRFAQAAAALFVSAPVADRARVTAAAVAAFLSAG